MNVSITVMEDADGNPSISYSGRDCTAALETLNREIASGKYVIGHVIRDPDTIKTRRYDPPSVAAAAAEPDPPAEKPRRK